MRSPKNCKPTSQRMSFRPPQSYQRLADLGLTVGEFWFGVEWCPVMRWVDYDPGRLAKYESTHPIGDYYMFAKAGGEPWCWHAERPMGGGEFEVHEVDLFMHIPYAPTFASFLFRQHLEGLMACRHLEDMELHSAPNAEIIQALFPQSYVEQVNDIVTLMQCAFEAHRENPFTWAECKCVLKRNMEASYVRG